MFIRKRLKGGLPFLGLLLVIAAAALVALAQSEMVSYLPIAFNLDSSFFGTFEREPNNSFSEANGGLCPEFFYSALPNDVDDFFFFETTGPGDIVVKVLGLNVGEGQVSLYREVAGSLPELVKTADSPPDYLLEMERTAEGKYYIHVQVSSAEPLPDPSPYSLQVSCPAIGVTPTPQGTPNPTGEHTPTPAEEATRVRETPSHTPETTGSPPPDPSPTSTAEPTRDKEATSTPTVTGSITPSPTVKATPTAPGGIPEIQNNSFEQGIEGWEQSTSTGLPLIVPETDTPFEARSGEWVARLGGELGDVSRLGQWVEVPHGVGSFYINYYQILRASEPRCSPDFVSDSLAIFVNGQLATEHTVCDMNNPSDWKLRDWPGHDFGQYAGQTIFVEIVLINNNIPDTVTTIYIDDVFFSE